MRSATLAFALPGALLLGCAQLAPPPTGPPPVANLEVEVLRGFGLPEAPLGDLPGSVQVVLDLSSSMRTATDSGPERWLGAAGGAQELLSGIAPESARLHVVGHRASEDQCDAGAGVDLADAETLRPVADGSVARALAGLEAEGRNAPGRVVVFSDLEDPCAAELCAAAERLVAAGSWIDWVLVGETPAPACLATLALPAEAAGPVAGALAQGPARFQVLQAGEPVISGMTGERVEVPSGAELEVVVALDPPERVGPIRIAAGEISRLRVLDFPMGDPPRRVWALEDERRFDPALPQAPEFQR
ncbi:MAG: hypothetical protein QNK05_00985 [Myxococcota bacterium]|nr:hypothetical protein [Myxococcota bacterium]